jgi:hypothetical protein
MLPNTSLIRDMSRSWLYFINSALTAQNIPFINQAGSALPSGHAAESSNAYVIAGPATEWRLNQGRLEAAFQLRIITRQQNGDGLAAYEQNLALQLMINALLFAPERYLTGFSTGQEEQYALPLWAFDESGTPIQAVDAYAITYGSQLHWVGRNAPGADRAVWTLDLMLRLERNL